LRVSKLCKEDVDKDVLKELDNLQNVRNKIVHEKYYKTWELSEIVNFETLVSSAIEDICRFGIARNFPGKYTCVSGENYMELASFALLSREKI
tara:strand:- start:811 stop:1089 length:279 start_codon:yes stop_codon:yes gene_type:complete